MAENKTTAIVTRIDMTDRGVQLRSLEDAFRFATMVCRSGCAPRSMDSPEKVLVAIQTGLEAGLTPLKALQSVVVINGLPSWKGDSALALVRDSGKMEWFRKGHTGEGEETVYWVESKRRDEPDAVRHEFGVKHAKKAALWGKAGPWSQYPGRMLYYRALGFHLRDQYSDVLMGLTTEHEAMDMPRVGAVAVAEVPTSEPDPLMAQIGPGVPEATVQDASFEDAAAEPANKQDQPEAKQTPANDTVDLNDIDRLFEKNHASK